MEKYIESPQNQSQLDQFKQKIVSQFILIKHNLSQITHKKIVQTLFIQQISPQSKIPFLIDDDFDLLQKTNPNTLLKKMVLKIAGSFRDQSKFYDISRTHLQKFYHLEDLKIKFIRLTYMVNSGSGQLLSQIKHLNHLKKLQISFQESNEVNYLTFNIFFKALQFQPQLEYLTLKISPGNKLTTQNLENMLISLKKMTQIKKLKLHINEYEEIEEEQCKLIKESLIPLKNIENFDFYINSNTIPDSGAKYIAQILKSYQKLKFLKFNVFYKQKEKEDTTKSQFSEELGKSLPILSKTLKNLFLNIMPFGYLGQEGFQNISVGLQNLVNLEHLKFGIQSFNGFQGEAGQYMGQSIKNLQKLKVLDLEIGIGNYMSNQALENLFQGMKQLKELKKLIFQVNSSNEIDQNGAISIGKALPCFNSLEDLYLVIDGNNIQVEGAQAIGQGVGVLKHEQKLKKYKLFIDAADLAEEEILNHGKNMSKNNNSIKKSNCCILI